MQRFQSNWTKICRHINICIHINKHYYEIIKNNKDNEKETTKMIVYQEKVGDVCNVMNEHCKHKIMCMSLHNMHCFLSQYGLECLVVQSCLFIIVHVLFLMNKCMRNSLTICGI